MSNVHDTYVYQVARRWFWNCPCGTEGGPFARRMDADDDASKHESAGSSTTQSDQ